VRAPRAASFPAPRRPLSACSAPPLPLPRAKAPSADESLRADLSRRLAFASCPRVPCPGVNQCLRARAFGPFAVLDVLRAIRNGGPPPVHAGRTRTRARRPTCFHELAHACLLDPPCLAGCSPEPASHMPPIDFCNRVAPRAHACEPPNPASWCLRSDHPPAARPLAGRSRPISADPGVARRRIAVSTPARRPLVVRIYPSSTSSRTPSCRDTDTGGDWKGSPAATCGRGTSLAGGSARLGSARPRPGHDLLAVGCR
jgi:hypothetical protein